MARIRTIKPAHWNDRQLTEISLQAHLLWIATWNFSDDKGIFENDPHLLKSQIFPRRTDIRIDQVKQWLDQLVKARFIIPFSFNGVSYYISRTFETHQKIDRPQPSKIPENEIVRIFDEYSTNDQRTLIPVEYSIVKESSVREKAPPPPKFIYSNDGFFDKQLEQFGDQQDIEKYKALVDFLHENLPDGRYRFANVLAMETQIGFREYLELKKIELAYGRSLREVIENMANKKNLTREYKDVYLTARNWLKRKFEKVA